MSADELSDVGRGKPDDPQVWEGDPFPHAPGSDVDADTWTLHHRFLYRIVLGAAGATSEEINLLYNAIAPVVYYGTTETQSDSRRWRHKLLKDLEAGGYVSGHQTPRGWVWIPTEGEDR